MPVWEDYSSTLAVDFLWTLFIAAVNSYRYDSVLRPFPRAYLQGTSEEKDIEKLKEAAFHIPSINSLNEKSENVPSESLDLLNWVLSASFKLIEKTKDEYSQIQSLTKQILPASKPNYIFEVIHSERKENKFQEKKNGFSSFYAYHGSRLENFYSILHNGLVAHLNKNALFGSGTYLSSELGISLLYSSGCAAWSKSILGPRLSCVAVCEVVDHPSVKCHTDDKNESHRSYSVDSMAGKLPEKYYIVQNNDFVIIRYLLVYTSKPNKTCRNSWWEKHRFAILMLSYIIVLLAVGLSSSTSFGKIFRSPLS